MSPFNSSVREAAYLRSNYLSSVKPQGWELKAEKRVIPFDSLKGTAGQVDNASCRSSYRAHQTFANTFEEARCSLFLRPCTITGNVFRNFKPNHSLLL